DCLDSDSPRRVGLFADLDCYGERTVSSGCFCRRDDLLAPYKLSHGNRLIVNRACFRLAAEARQIDTRFVALGYGMRVFGGAGDQHRVHIGPLHAWMVLSASVLSSGSDNRVNIAARADICA